MKIVTTKNFSFNKFEGRKKKQSLTGDPDLIYYGVRIGS